MTNNNRVHKKFRILIWALSILIPVIVAILFNVKIPGVERMGFLPPTYATLNGFTALILVIAFFQIKKGNRKSHERLMKLAILCSALFLLMYILYHMTSESTPYGGTGALRYIYFAILISHILMSIAIIPLVLITYFRGITQQFEKHRKIARITFPLWLYVAISGVIIYIMISPYY